MPEAKEAEILTHVDSHKQVARNYDCLYRRAKPDQLLGDASTFYTKRPLFEGDAARAHSLAGRDLKIVYMLSASIERTVIRYHHKQQRRHLDCPFLKAIRSDPGLIDFSRYGWQIEAWIAEFGKQRVLQVELADYARDWTKAVRHIVGFLGADPPVLDVSENRVVERVDDPNMANNYLLWRFVSSHFYRRRMKPLIRSGVRSRARQLILKTPKLSTLTFSTEDRDYILMKLANPHGPS